MHAIVDLRFFFFFFFLPSHPSPGAAKDLCFGTTWRISVSPLLCMFDVSLTWDEKKSWGFVGDNLDGGVC